ncbi:hypothetical protein ES703_121057 [subsurface metagenome]
MHRSAGDTLLPGNKRNLVPLILLKPQGVDLTKHRMACGGKAGEMGAGEPLTKASTESIIPPPSDCYSLIPCELPVISHPIPIRILLESSISYHISLLGGANR